MTTFFTLPTLRGSHPDAAGIPRGQLLGRGAPISTIERYAFENTGVGDATPHSQSRHRRRRAPPGSPLAPAKAWRKIRRKTVVRPLSWGFVLRTATEFDTLHTCVRMDRM